MDGGVPVSVKGKIFDTRFGLIHVQTGKKNFLSRTDPPSLVKGKFFDTRFGLIHVQTGKKKIFVKGPPPPGIARNCYGHAAGGMPLAFTQEDFLVLHGVLPVEWSTLLWTAKCRGVQNKIRILFGKMCYALKSLLANISHISFCVIIYLFMRTKLGDKQGPEQKWRTFQPQTSLDVEIHFLPAFNLINYKVKTSKVINWDLYFIL